MTGDSTTIDRQAVAAVRIVQGDRSRWVRPDVLAGLTVWAVLVPEALAYATIAGALPVVGLSPIRELIGLGGANLGSGLCSGMVINGSLSKAAVNGPSQTASHSNERSGTTCSIPVLRR